MARIRCLKANVSREQALQHFSSGLAARLSQAAFGPLRSVADFYIPFRLFHIEVVNAGQRELSLLALDAVDGSLDPYRLEQLPGEGDVMPLETRNCAEPLLDEAEARKIIITKVERLLFSRSFFRVRDLSISAEPVAGEIYVPYWIGFRGRGARPHFTVLDALRRRPEGAKLRRLLQEWLTEVR